MYRNGMPMYTCCQLLDKLSEHVLKNIIVRVIPTVRFVAMPIKNITEKCGYVDVSSGRWVCHLPNNCERG